MTPTTEPYVLMNRETGEGMSDVAHLRQSLIVLLTTPVGSRVMRREYGSRLPLMLDRNVTRRLLADWVYAIGEAIYKWEPRYRVKQVQINTSSLRDGVLALTLEGWYVPEGIPLRLDRLELRYFAATT